MSSYLRLQAEIEASKRIALQRELELQQIYEGQIWERERSYLRFREAQKIRAQQEYEEYQLRRAKQHLIAEDHAIQQRIVRETASKDYTAQVLAQRLASQARDKSLETNQRLAEQAELRKVEAHAASVRAELQRKQQLKSNIDKQNLAILDEQNIQQKFERQLNEIDIKIGQIYDSREQRKRKQVQELQELDRINFQLNQSLTSSKVKQQAHQDSIVSLTNLIVS